jgi:hypothetical protein
MFVACLKMTALAAAMLGPFTVGAMSRFIRDPETFAFFLVAGIGTGIAGVFGFAALERVEGERHGRLKAGVPSVPGQEG